MAGRISGCSTRLEPGPQLSRTALHSAKSCHSRVVCRALPGSASVVILIRPSMLRSKLTCRVVPAVLRMHRRARRRQGQTGPRAWRLACRRCPQEPRFTSSRCRPTNDEQRMTRDDATPDAIPDGYAVVSRLCSHAQTRELGGGDRPCEFRCFASVLALVGGRRTEPVDCGWDCFTWAGLCGAAILGEGRGRESLAWEGKCDLYVPNILQGGRARMRYREPASRDGRA